MKQVTLERSMGCVKGDKLQTHMRWLEFINPDSVLVGRAVTAILMPGRPDIHRAIDDRGHNQRMEE